MKLTELTIGNKLELELYDNEGKTIKPTFVSELEWVEDENIAVIAAPIYEGIIYPVPIGTYMEVYFTRKYEDSGRIEMYKFRAEVLGRKTIDNIAVLEVEILSEIEKIQRRQFFRFECSIPIKYRQAVSFISEHNKGIQYKKTYTRDISGGGLCFVTEEKLEMNKILEIELTLAEDDVRNFFGTIVRVIKLEDTDRHCYEIGILFRKIDNKDREAIIKFIFVEQRKLRKKGLI
ncbi:MAG: flagellar brake protein [Clostridia bacterium]|nr:flagellar brake protein [Clostridia bacterium]